MRCPYRTYTSSLVTNGDLKRMYDTPIKSNTNFIETHFMDCYKDECPLYDNGTCIRVKKEIGYIVDSVS